MNFAKSSLLLLAALSLLLFPLLLVLAIAGILSIANVPAAAVERPIANGLAPVGVHGVLAVLCFPALLPVSLLLLLTSKIYLAALMLLAFYFGRVPATSGVSRHWILYTVKEPCFSDIPTVAAIPPCCC